MKTVISILLLISVLILSGCSSTFEITKHIDKNDSTVTIYTSESIKIKGDLQSDSYKTYMTYRCNSSSGKKEYAFSFRYVGGQFLVLSELMLNINGLKYNFTTDRIPTRKQDGLLGLSEEIYFSLPEDIVLEIIENNNCRMTIIGKHDKIIANMKKAWIEDLTKFYIEVNK